MTCDNRFSTLTLTVMMAGVLSLGLVTTDAEARKTAAAALEKMDRDGDGQLSRAEWRKKKIFDSIDRDGDGYLSTPELQILFGEVDGGSDRPDRVTMGAIRRAKFDDVAHLKQRGLFETGLKPVWGDGVECRAIDHWYAMDYTKLRPKEAYHGGIDIPAPFGTPVLAAMAGEVVAKYEGKQNPRGIEIVLRHTPQQSGLPYYLYSRYTHLDKMSPLAVGSTVAMGETVGETGNTGPTGCEVRGELCKGSRRPVLHFDLLYSENEKYFDSGEVLVPFDAYWMDPTALYRNRLPLDSYAMRDLPTGEKSVTIAYQLESGERFPADTRMIWPYACKPR